MNETIRTMQSHRSIRSHTDEPVSNDIDKRGGKQAAQPRGLGVWIQRLFFVN